MSSAQSNTESSPSCLSAPATPDPASKQSSPTPQTIKTNFSDTIHGLRIRSFPLTPPDENHGNQRLQFLPEQESTAGDLLASTQFPLTPPDEKAPSKLFGRRNVRQLLDKSQIKEKLKPLPGSKAASFYQKLSQLTAAEDLSPSEPQQHGRESAPDTQDTESVEHQGISLPESIPLETEPQLEVKARPQLQRRNRLFQSMSEAAKDTGSILNKYSKSQKQVESPSPQDILGEKEVQREPQLEEEDSECAHGDGKESQVKEPESLSTIWSPLMQIKAAASGHIDKHVPEKDQPSSSSPPRPVIFKARKMTMAEHMPIEITPEMLDSPGQLIPKIAKAVLAEIPQGQRAFVEYCTTEASLNLALLPKMHWALQVGENYEEKTYELQGSEGRIQATVGKWGPKEIGLQLQDTFKDEFVGYTTLTDTQLDEVAKKVIIFMKNEMGTDGEYNEIYCNCQHFVFLFGPAILPPGTASKLLGDPERIPYKWDLVWRSEHLDCMGKRFESVLREFSTRTAIGQSDNPDSECTSDAPIADALIYANEAIFSALSYAAKTEITRLNTPLHPGPGCLCKTNIDMKEICIALQMLHETRESIKDGLSFFRKLVTGDDTTRVGRKVRQAYQRVTSNGGLSRGFSGGNEQFRVIYTA
ncbi:hypothetical protein BJ508DRAFT_363614 [Ascobolus immersus RN42]|uniref:Uncharacterized protein n=1 Tax=Ascobolus immersus RN42 TaxID=1160509 RepID=A0A3N4I0E6_ASCIM|nr:hypothetical protein BJ508DRAFT_363614 [Ascobolus immersus RN42]